MITDTFQLPSDALPSLPMGVRCIVNHTLETAHELLKTTPAVAPVFMMVAPRGDVPDAYGMVGCALDPKFFDSPSSKDRLDAIMRAEAERLGAVATVFIHEIWLVERAPHAAAGVIPSQAPDRQEALGVVVSSKWGGGLLTQRLVRNDAGVHLFGIEWASTTDRAGRFLDVVATDPTLAEN